MTGEPITVGVLRALLADNPDIPDDMPLSVGTAGSADWVPVMDVFVDTEDDELVLVLYVDEELG